MKYYPQAFFFFFFLAACSTTTNMVASWKDQGAEPKKYQKVAVVALTPNMEGRATVEEAVAGQLRAKGIKAYATFNTFPFAGKIGELDFDKATIERKIREKINDNHFDALLTIVMLDKQKEERYVEGSSISLAAP